MCRRLVMRLRILFACGVLIRRLMSDFSLLGAWSHLSSVIYASINRGLMSFVSASLRTAENWLPHWLQITELAKHIKIGIRSVLKQSLDLRGLSQRIVVLIGWDAPRSASQYTYTVVTGSDLKFADHRCRLAWRELAHVIGGEVVNHLLGRAALHMHWVRCWLMIQLDYAVILRVLSSSVPVRMIQWNPSSFRLVLI